jgi:hypothetical protein
VRFSFFAILPAVVLFRATVFKICTSAVVQERRFPFFMIYLTVVKRARLTARVVPYYGGQCQRPIGNVRINPRGLTASVLLSGVAVADSGRAIGILGEAFQVAILAS